MHKDKLAPNKAIQHLYYVYLSNKLILETQLIETTVTTYTKSEPVLITKVKFACLDF